MAKKFSELPAASTLTGTELVPVVQGGVTKQTTLASWTSGLAGDLTFSGAGRSIKGEFGGAILDQPSIKSTVTNTAALLNIVPNGSIANASGASGLRLISANYVANAGSSGAFGVVIMVENTSMRFISNAAGGAWLPIEFVTSGATQMTITTSGSITPGADGTQAFGAAGLRWGEIFCANATINTSDAREKTSVRQLNANERAAAKALAAEIGIYQFMNAVAEKGEDGARLHTGMTVQRAIEVMEAHGLDPMRYGFICHDEWAERVEEIEDEAGDQVRIVPQQATIDTEVETSEIELINGIPTLVRRPTVQRTPATELRAVVAEDGTPVLGEDEQPLMYPVPVMRDVEQRFRRVVTPAGDRFSFRETRLILFILAGIAESL